MIISWYQYLQILCLICAIIFWKALRKHSIEAFLPLIVLINVTELIGNNYQNFRWTNNYFVYNIYLVLSTPLWLYLYKNMLNLSGTARTIYYAISFLCMSFILINYFFFQGFSNFNTYSIILVMLFSLVFSALVLFKTVTVESSEVVLLREPFFWINGANLLFALISLVLLGLQQYIRVNHIEMNRKSLYYAILPAANVVLYLAFGLAFYLCQVKMNKSSLR
jgi:hypothetical protein